MLRVRTCIYSRSGNLSIPQFLTGLKFSLLSFNFKPGIDYFRLVKINLVKCQDRLVGRDINFPLPHNYEPLFPRRNFVTPRRTMIPKEFLHKIGSFLCDTNIVQRIVEFILSTEHLFMEHGVHEYILFMNLLTQYPNVDIIDINYDRLSVEYTFRFQFDSFSIAMNVSAYNEQEGHLGEAYTVRILHFQGMNNLSCLAD